MDAARRGSQLKRGEHDDPTAVRPRSMTFRGAWRSSGGASSCARAWCSAGTKKATGWAAIITVPTFITGFFRMNVPYRRFGQKGGLAASIASIASIAIIALAGLLLYLIFKRKDWL